MHGFDINKLDEYEQQKLCFRGKDIRDYIMHNLDSDDLDIKHFSKCIYESYYKSEKMTSPADSQYYYIYNYIGAMKYIIKRDLVVSPESKKYPIQEIRYKDMRTLLDNIDCVEFEIKFNPKFNKYDEEELKRIHKLLNYRLNLVLRGRKFNVNRMHSLSNYTLMQIHSVYSDMMEDLNTMKCNIF